MSHPIQNFFAALSVLARHGHIKERLTRAYEQNLREIEESQLPIPMRQPFADLRQRMYRVAPLNGEGSICASVRKMSIDEADDCAELLVELYGLAMRHAEDTQAPLPLVEDDEVVPPFLVKSG